MKRLIVFLLSVAFLLSSFAGCSAPAVPVDESSVTVTSSSLSSYGDWLEARLEADGVPATDIIIGDASTADEYGLDLSDFVSDEGYIIRRDSPDEPVLIFGTNAESVDTAVRYYANYCDKSAVLNVVEGESYRVGNITIGGHDLSEFVIVCPADADECQKFAATELQRFLGDACGIYPEIVTETDGLAITLVCDKTGETYGDEAFNIKSHEGGITITGGRYRGCMYGVYQFLEDYIGYRFYYKDLSGAGSATGKIDNATPYLYEAESISLDGIDLTMTPSITVRDTFAYNALISPAMKYNGQFYDNVGVYGGYGRITKACHGIVSYISDNELDALGYEAGYSYGVNACLTDEYLNELLIERVLMDLGNHKNGGTVFGKTFSTVDISQRDISNFCMCSDCTDVYKETGAVSGAVIRQANMVAEAIEKDYPAITVAVLAYFGTSTPPKNIEIHKNVQVSFCFYISDNKQTFVCGNHSINGTECETNKYFADLFDGWATLTDNLYVWYYPTVSYYNGYSSNYTNNLYHDIKYLADKNTYGIFYLADPGTDSAFFINWYMGQRMMWDSSITEEEYHEMLKEFLWLTYGDGYESVYEFIQIMESAANHNDCFCGFHNNFFDKLNMSYLKDKFDDIFALREHALRLARTSTQENMIDSIFATAYYFEIAVMHNDMWVEGDDASRETYKAKVDYFLTHYNWLRLSDNGPIGPALSEVDYNVNPFEWHPIRHGSGWGNYEY